MTDGRKSIRKIDREVYLEALVFSVWNRQNMGRTVSDALRFYLDHCPDDPTVSAASSR